MKSISKILFFAGLFFLTNACNLKDELTVNVPIPENEISFKIGTTGPVSVSQASRAATASQAEVVLLDQILKVNVESELKKQNMSVDIIKSLVLTQASIAITVPDGYADYVALLNSFKTVKLYFDNQTQLVAEGKSVTISGRKGVVEITVKNPELLDKLKNDQLHIILTGEKYPPIQLSAVLKTTYTAKVRLLN